MTKPQTKESPLAKLALEFGPLLVFFLANSRGEQLIARFPELGALGGPIFLATALFMVAMAISLVTSWAITRRLAIMPLITGVVVAIFGTLTLILKDDTFIKLKPTIVNVLIGGVLLGGLAFGKSLISYVFESAFTLNEAGWKKLTLRWGLFFLFLAALNEVVWRTQSTDFWVAFKVWGTMPLSIIFALAQIPLMKRHGADFGEETSSSETP